jgi:tetratricopeptide (TPR) repeat protein
MTARWKTVACAIGAALIVASVCCAADSAEAQGEVHPGTSTADNDAPAREHFTLGRAAYRGADYEQALMHFRRAYELSHRSQLKYNIGISADRLGKNEEALEAFESYLEENENPPREQEVRERIAFLRLAVEESKEKELLLAEAAARDAVAALDEPPSDRKIPQSAIAGGSVLAAVGVAGVTTMGLGLSQNGSCLERDASGVCTSERTVSPWTFVYGAVGLAALAGSTAWFTVSSRRAKRERASTWMLTPTGVMVSGSF